MERWRQRRCHSASNAAKHWSIAAIVTEGYLLPLWSGCSSGYDCCILQLCWAGPVVKYMVFLLYCMCLLICLQLTTL